MNINNDLRFSQEFSTFIRHMPMSLLIVLNLIIFNNGKVTDVLARPPNYFWIMTNVCMENLPLFKYYMSAIWYQQSIRCCLHCECLVCLPQASAQTFSCFGISSDADASLSLSIKRRAVSADVMLVCFYLSIFCCFGCYQKIINWIIVLEINVTRDVINSNLVLIVLTLCCSSVQTFFERAKFAKLSW